MAIDSALSAAAESATNFSPLLTTLTVMKKTLEMYGFIVHAIAYPISALEMFNKNSHYCSLVLSDITMSKMSGFDFAKRISNINRNVKVLLMTALDIDLFEFRKFVSSAQVAGTIDGCSADD